MKATKKEYLAQYQLAYDPDRWSIATPRNFPIGKRYCSTLAEAQQALDEARAYFNGKPKTISQKCGAIGITTHVDSKSAKNLAIVKTRIRVREVTEWEVVEEE